MRIQKLDPNWDTVIVVQEEVDGRVKKQVKFGVLAQAIRLSPYCKNTTPAHAIEVLTHADIQKGVASSDT